MRTFRQIVTTCAALLPCVALAQTKSPVPGLPVSPIGATAQASEPAATATPSPRAAADIVVRGTRERLSSWKRAETGHAILYSNGSESDLRRVAGNLERLHILMSRVFGRGDTPDDMVKLSATLIGDSDFMRHMRLNNTRSAEGPYPEPFDTQRYYDPRDDGAVLAVSRSDLYFALGQQDDGPSFYDSDDKTAVESDYSLDNQNEGFNADPAGGLTAAMNRAVGIGGAGTGKRQRQQPEPEIRRWEAMLYAGFAQHFMLSYFPAAYPRWYLDGIGALFSTFEVRKDGSVEYGLPPSRYRQIIAAFGGLNIERVLTGASSTSGSVEGWSPYHAWILTHFFFFADPSSARRIQFVRYMSRVAQGEPLADAAKAFGDLRVLQQEVTTYGSSRTNYQRVSLPTDSSSDPLVQQLRVSDAALLKARVELGARLDIPELAVAETSARDAARAKRAHSAALDRRESYLANLRRDVGKLPYNRKGLLLLAEAECRTGHVDGCDGAAGAVLAKEPNDSTALAWRAFAQIAQAKAATPEARSAAFAAARRTIGIANRSDTEAVLPILAYFRSFADAGQPAPDLAQLGMVKVISQVPTAPGPRVMLGRELMRQGHADAARRIMLPVLYGGYASPERSEASDIMSASIPPAGR